MLLSEELYLKWKRRRLMNNFHPIINRTLLYSSICFYIIIFVVIFTVMLTTVIYGFNSRKPASCTYVKRSRRIIVDVQPITIPVKCSKRVSGTDFFGMLDVCPRKSLKEAERCFNNSGIVMGASFRCSVDDDLLILENSTYQILTSDFLDTTLRETSEFLVVSYLTFICLAIIILIGAAIVWVLTSKYYDAKINLRLEEERRQNFQSDVADINELRYSLEGESSGLLINNNNSRGGSEGRKATDGAGGGGGSVSAAPTSKAFSIGALEHLRKTTVEETEVILWAYTPTLKRLISANSMWLILFFSIHIIALVVAIISIVVFGVGRVQGWWQILFLLFFMMLVSPLTLGTFMYVFGLKHTRYFLTTSRIIMFKKFIFFGYLFQVFYNDVVSVDPKGDCLLLVREKGMGKRTIFKCLEDAASPASVIADRINELKGI